MATILGSNVGDIFGDITRGLGMREMGWSELFGGNKNSLVRNAYAEMPTPDENNAIQESTTTTTSPTYSTPTSYTTPTGGDSGGSSGGGSGGSKEPDSKKIRSAIDDRYNSIVSGLDKMLGQLWSQKPTDQQFIQNQGQILTSSAQGAYDTNINKLNTLRGNVVSNKAQSVRELGENLRNAMMASGQYIGALGGGDSSASEVMMPWAYSKLATKEGGNIQRQANSQLGDIDMREMDVKQVFDDAKSNIDMWVQTKTSELENWYKTQAQQLEQMKLNATAERANAIAALEEKLFDNAYNAYQQIQFDARAFNQQLQAWAADKYSNLEAAKLQMANSSNYNPADIVTNALSYARQAPSLGQGFDQFIAGGKKRDQYGNIIR